MTIAERSTLGISAPQFETKRRRDTHFEPDGVFFDCRPAMSYLLSRERSVEEQNKRFAIRPIEAQAPIITAWIVAFICDENARLALPPE
jgi:hypothetical protein